LCIGVGGKPIDRTADRIETIQFAFRKPDPANPVRPPSPPASPHPRHAYIIHAFFYIRNCQGLKPSFFSGLARGFISISLTILPFLPASTLAPVDPVKEPVGEP